MKLSNDVSCEKNRRESIIAFFDAFASHQLIFIETKTTLKERFHELRIN